MKSEYSPVEGKRPDQIKRRPVILSSVVETAFLGDGAKAPLVFSPALPGLDLAGWACHSRPLIESSLYEYGAVLFRGFPVSNANQFASVVKALGGDPLEYKERSSPRTRVIDNIYSSTDYPADQRIFVHNENSYQRQWPRKIFFFCEKAAEEGGETPIADCRQIYNRVDAEVVARFLEKGWMYVRNFGTGFGLDWRTVFQTSCVREVEDHCRKNQIQWEWTGTESDGLRTYSVRKAIAKHPVTGEFVWFNHATFFNVATLEPRVRDALIREFGEGSLPANTYYGDGAVIEAWVLDHLRDLYDRNTVVFPWMNGDILLVDNMLVAHGRMPYAGSRKVLVAMTDAFGEYGV